MGNSLKTALATALLAMVANHAGAATTMPDNNLSLACQEAIRLNQRGPDALQPCLLAVDSGSPVDALTQAQLRSAMAWYYARQRANDAALTTMAQINPAYANDVTVLNNLGNAYLEQGQFDLALTQYDLALAQARAQTARRAIQLNRSIVLRALGRYAQAHEAYRDTLDEDLIETEDKVFDSAGGDTPSRPTGFVDRPVPGAGSPR